MPDRLVKLITSFCYLGFLPVAGGSAASIVGGILCLALQKTIFFYLFILIVVCSLGFALGGRMEKITGQEDPDCVVIDEVAGAMIAFFFLPATPAVYVTAFFLFRAFDMFKIYPANKFEKVPGGFGVMMDDVVAGIYTNLTMQVAVRLAGIG